MAQKVKKYEIGIDQKIKDAILGSDYLIPILTNNGLGSPSVNQEIGFAIGHGLPVIVMIEKETKLGVFVHGREPEEFTKETFYGSCTAVADYLAREGKMRLSASRTSANDFLVKRRLVDPEREEFTINQASDLLHDETLKKEHPPNTAKRLVLFSACPAHLLDDVEVTSEKTVQWLKENSVVDMHGHRFNYFQGFPREKINLNLLTYKWFDSDKLKRYMELHNNGYLEEGISDRIIREVPFRNNYQDINSGLHLCWVTGAYWAFLLFARNYYDSKQVADDIKVSLSIHNARDLMLFGFGGDLGNGRKWADPVKFDYFGEKPQTDSLNVHVPDSIKARTSDDEIAKIARRTSDKLSNAYGYRSSPCYNHDGTFEVELFSYYRF